MKRLGHADSSTVVSIRLPRSVRERLERLASVQGKSLAVYVREVLAAASSVQGSASVTSVPILERFPYPPPVSAQAAPFEDLWLSMTSAQSGSDEASL